MRRHIFSALATTALAGLVVATPPAATADVPDFRVGIQLADRGGSSGFGVERFTGFARFGDGVSPWAGDSDNFDPDAARIELDTNTLVLAGRDFRVGIQARDAGAHEGTIEYTDWASQGGGLSEIATDDDAFDPDQYRVFLDTRSMPAGEEVNDFRLSIQAVDQGMGGIPVNTPWANQGGGRSPFAVDRDAFDPDGFKIGLEVR